MNKLSNDFEFLYGHSLTNMNLNDLQKILKYSEDINIVELYLKKLTILNKHALSIFPSIESVSFLDILQMIHVESRVFTGRAVVLMLDLRASISASAFKNPLRINKKKKRTT